MNENDRLQMYEAQAIARENEQRLEERTRELEEKTRELEEARREIERLRVTTEQTHLREAIAGIEQNTNANFNEMNQNIGDLRLQLSNLQQTFDEKIAENLQLQETVAQINEERDCPELDLYISVILFGGYCNNYRTDSICLYNSKEKKWINSSLKLPDILSSHGSVILNDEIYIFGGFNRNYFKSTYKLGENLKWIKLANINEERSSFGSLVFDDEIWVFGGLGGITARKTVEKYNPQRNTWTLMPEMNQAKSHVAVSIINGKFYVSGGYPGGKYLDEIEVFDPKKNKWEFFCKMPFGLCNHTSTVDGTNLIIIGGEKSDREASNEVWKIDILNLKKEWKQLPNLQQKRCKHNAVKLVDGLMVIGGEIKRGTETDSVEIFDGQKWKEGPKLPESRRFFSSIPLTSQNEKEIPNLQQKRYNLDAADGAVALLCISSALISAFLLGRISMER